MIDGIVALSKSKFYAVNAVYVFSDLRTWGLDGARRSASSRSSPSFAILGRAQWARWFGIVRGVLSARLGQFAFMQSYPFWSIAIFDGCASSPSTGWPYTAARRSASTRKQLATREAATTAASRVVRADQPVGVPPGGGTSPPAFFFADRLRIHQTMAPMTTAAARMPKAIQPHWVLLVLVVVWLFFAIAAPAAAAAAALTVVVVSVVVAAVVVAVVVVGGGAVTVAVVVCVCVSV